MHPAPVWMLHRYTLLRPLKKKKKSIACTNCVTWNLTNHDWLFNFCSILTGYVHKFAISFMELHLMPHHLQLFLSLYIAFKETRNTAFRAVECVSPRTLSAWENRALSSLVSVASATYQCAPVCQACWNLPTDALLYIVFMSRRFRVHWQDRLQKRRNVIECLSLQRGIVLDMTPSESEGLDN